MCVDIAAGRKGAATAASAVLIAVFIAVIGVRQLVVRRLRAGGRRPTISLPVVNADDSSVTLPVSTVSVCSGRFGLRWDSGWTQIPAIVARQERTVTWRWVGPDRPPAGAAVLWNKFVFVGDPLHARGITYQEVGISARCGLLPAWFVPGSRDVWALLVHGRGATREETLRVLPTVTDLGFPTLALTYRNDAGAPATVDGLYRLGDTEWQDLEDATVYALSCGAVGVVMYGWSMGGSIVETFLDRSSYASKVRAVILDAPILSPGEMIQNLVRRYRLPACAGHLAKAVAARATRIDFDALNHVDRPTRVKVPTLLIHGSADAVAPVWISDRFADAHRDSVRYLRVQGAGHTLAWNVVPETYERTVTDFLRSLDEQTSNGRCDAAQ